MHDPVTELETPERGWGSRARRLTAPLEWPTTPSPPAWGVGLPRAPETAPAAAIGFSGIDPPAPGPASVAERLSASRLPGGAAGSLPGVPGSAPRHGLRGIPLIP